MSFRSKLFLCFLVYLAGVLVAHSEQFTLISEVHLWILCLTALLVSLQSLFRARLFDFSFWTILLSFAVLGFVNHWAMKRVQSDHFSKTKAVVVDAELVEIKSSGSGQKLIAEVRRSYAADLGPKSSTGKILLHSKEVLEFSIGDVLQVPIHPKLILNNPDFEFDRAAYWKRKGVYHEQYLRDEFIFFPNENHQLSVGIRSWLLSRLNKLYDERARGFLNALLMGDKSTMASEEKSTFKRAGLMHMLVVSGMHVGIVYLLISLMLKPFQSFRFYPLLHLSCILFGIWTYAYLTGNGVSVQRACIMLSIYSVLTSFQRKLQGVDVLMISAFLLLSLRPSELFSLGFQLSYAAMLGIFFLYPKLNALFKPKLKVMGYAWNLTCISLAAQLGTMPLISHYFGEIAVYSLASNLLVSPVLILVMATSMLNIAFIDIPYASIAFQESSSVLIQYVWSIAHYFAEKSNAVIAYETKVEGVLWMYLVALTTAFGLKAKRIKWVLIGSILLLTAGLIVTF